MHTCTLQCDPNLVVYGVWIDTLDPRLPRIALFACRDIAAGEELTFDYQMTGKGGNNSKPPFHFFIESSFVDISFCGYGYI